MLEINFFFKTFIYASTVLLHFWLFAFLVVLVPGLDLPVAEGDDDVLVQHLAPRRRLSRRDGHSSRTTWCRAFLVLVSWTKNRQVFIFFSKTCFKRAKFSLTVDQNRGDRLGCWDEFVQKARFKKLVCLLHVKLDNLTYLGRVCTPCLSVSTV